MPSLQTEVSNRRAELVERIEERANPMLNPCSSCTALRLPCADGTTDGKLILNLLFGLIDTG